MSLAFVCESSIGRRKQIHDLEYVVDRNLCQMAGKQTGDEEQRTSCKTIRPLQVHRKEHVLYYLDYLGILVQQLDGHGVGLKLEQVSKQIRKTEEWPRTTALCEQLDGLCVLRSTLPSVDNFMTPKQ